MRPAGLVTTMYLAGLILSQRRSAIRSAMMAMPCSRPSPLPRRSLSWQRYIQLYQRSSSPMAGCTAWNKSTSRAIYGLFYFSWDANASGFWIGVTANSSMVRLSIWRRTTREWQAGSMQPAGCIRTIRGCNPKLQNVSMTFYSVATAPRSRYDSRSHNLSR